MVALQLQGVGLRHARMAPGTAPALDAVEVEVSAGEQVAVIGPSGAGKSTLLEVAGCVRTPDEGCLLWNGGNPWLLTRPGRMALRQQLALAPQVPPLPPRQRVVTAVLAGLLPGMGRLSSLRMLLWPREAACAHEALAAVGLAEKLYERVDRLSGGERQRVGLARVLVGRAQLWLLDEPLSALDPARAEQVLQVMLARAHQRGATVVASLHQVDLALAHFPRVVGLRAGRVAFDLPVHAVTPACLQALYADEGPVGKPVAPPACSEPGRSGTDDLTRLRPDCALPAHGVERHCPPGPRC